MNSVDQASPRRKGYWVSVYPSADWEKIEVVALKPMNGTEPIKAVAPADHMAFLRGVVRSWNLDETAETRALQQLDRLERKYRDYRASQINGDRSRMNWAFVVTIGSSLVFWPLAVYGAWKLLGL